MIRQTFDVPEIHCSMCVMRLEEIEDELQGITRVQASHQKRQMQVDYDETQVSQAQILAAIEKRGYAATVRP